MKIIERFGSVALGVVFIATAFLLGSCEQGEQVEPTFDRSGLIVETKVKVHDRLRDMHNAYKDVHNLPNSHDLTGLQGFAVWYEFPNGKPSDELYTCEIHIVRPSRVDDNNTLTLGHEMLHCIYGSYHKQKH